MTRTLRLLALSTAFLAIQPIYASTQSVGTEPPPEEQADDMSVIVTGTRVRQGGAQDIRHFRSVAAEVGMPRPESLTMEGLMGEHDLNIEGRDCDQLFCLATASMPAALPTRPDDRLFVGLGFTSNVDDAHWRREPLNLVAVVDKSGSMSGPPLDLVRRSLRQIVGQMREGDQVSIILYGDTSAVYLQPTEVGRDRDRILAAIDRIESAGSTNMEAGLKVGYETAFATAPAFLWNTRLMLFTDEQPNVGRTDADSFIGMAQAASQRGIGLTTIGVGVQFDASLATRVSSTRGGNLFFISNPDEVQSVFHEQLDTMVSELAHDVRITMMPREGYRISGVFGVPDGLMTDAGDGAVTITVPTAFLSTNGGGIFLSLAKGEGQAYLPAAGIAPGSPLLEVSLTYVGAQDQRPGTDRVTVTAPTGAPAANLRLAHLLVDEYFSLTAATTAFHQRNDPREAFRLLSGLSTRIAGSSLSGLDGERRLVGDMLQQASFYAGYAGEMPRTLRHLAVVGNWRVNQAEGFEDIRNGDTMAFSADRELTTTRRRPRGNEEAEESENYQINERQIFLTDSDLVLDYRAQGNRMTLVDDTGRARLRLTRIAATD
ncbi:MAG TPA: VWA domain-containing protein [Allosphingosinicella sp.]|nr:VWA domain-containing protein [Allosphingosinicella sp.]